MHILLKPSQKLNEAFQEQLYFMIFVNIHK